MGGNWYFCLLVDDWSGYIWYCPVTKKSDFGEWFMKMDKLFLNQFGTHVKVLHSNRGGKYVNNLLESFCTDNRIVLEHSVTHTPEQNGVAKWANWKVKDKLHTLLKDAGAPDFLWADTGAIAAYSINCTISASLGGVTPYEAFYGKYPSVDHM